MPRTDRQIGCLRSNSWCEVATEIEPGTLAHIWLSHQWWQCPHRAAPSRGRRQRCRVVLVQSGLIPTAAAAWAGAGMWRLHWAAAWASVQLHCGSSPDTAAPAAPAAATRRSVASKDVPGKGRLHGCQSQPAARQAMDSMNHPWPAQSVPRRARRPPASLARMSHPRQCYEHKSVRTGTLSPTIADAKQDGWVER